MALMGLIIVVCFVALVVESTNAIRDRLARRRRNSTRG